VKVEGEREFEAPRDTVWEVLNSPDSMAKLIPGVESFEIKDDRHWQANVKIPLGLGGLSMKMNFEKVEERPPEFAKLASKGTGVGAMMNMETSFDLSEREAGRTHMKWLADVKIAGPVGSMGQRVLQPIVNQQVGNVLAALDRQVQEAKAAGAAGAAGGAAAASEPGSSGAEEGLSPLAPESYDREPEGPTSSTGS
jgi:carbon monoxide dehydrogenase subunit G